MHIGYYTSPIGELAVQAEAGAITFLQFVEERSIEPNENELIIECKDQLHAYFNGKRTTFNLPHRLSLSGFQKDVLDVVEHIPYGKVNTYQEIARKVGGVEKVRAVGAANGRNPLWIIVPCHRVIGSNGELTGYAGGLDRKRWLLQHEGALSQLQLF